MIVLLILFGLVLGFVFYTRRFRNPYRLIFIFGKKGAGKSCYMVREMLKHLKKGWLVYTDMSDCNIPGIRIIDGKDLSAFAPEYHSCLFLDEVGISFDNRNFKSFDSGLRDFFKFQRKYKCKIYMNSQAFDVDKKIRDVTDSMILQTSILDCISISRPIKRTVTLTEPSAEAESRIADRLVFEPIWNWHFYWMPHYFKYFDSFAAPERAPISFTEVAGEALPAIRKLRLESVKTALKGVWNK